MSNKVDSRDTKKRHGMEIKIGVGLLAILLVALGAVLFSRMTGSNDVPTVAIGEAGQEAQSSTDTEQANEPTLLLSQPYSAKTAYDPEPEKPSVNWKQSESESSADSQTPKQSLSAKAAEFKLTSSEEPNRIPRGFSPSKPPAYNASTGYRGYNARQSSQSAIPPAKASSGSSNIPPAGQGDQDNSTSTQNENAYNPGDSASIPSASSSLNTLRSGADQHAMIPPQAAQVAQQQAPMTYAASGAALGTASSTSSGTAANRGYQNSRYQDSAAQRPLTSNATELTAAQSSGTSPYTQALPSQYTVPQNSQRQLQSVSQRSQQRHITPTPPSTLPKRSPVVKGKTHVQPGETMWTLSRRVYGSSAFFKALSEHNRQRLPNSHDLKIGDEVLVPELAVLRRRYPGLCPRERKRKAGASITTTVSATMVRAGRTYVVEKGDTLYDIARYELGSGAQWPEIYQLNRRALGSDFDYLKPGTKLTLPARGEKANDPAGDALAERPGQTHLR